ncbi:hypothetical protein SGPA1_20665 [Streptomyces misionensis JCM 4497]
MPAGPDRGHRELHRVPGPAPPRRQLIFEGRSPHERQPTAAGVDLPGPAEHLRRPGQRPRRGTPGPAARPGRGPAGRAQRPADPDLRRHLPDRRRRGPSAAARGRAAAPRRAPAAGGAERRHRLLGVRRLPDPRPRVHQRPRPARAGPRTARRGLGARRGRAVRRRRARGHRPAARAAPADRLREPPGRHPSRPHRPPVRPHQDRPGQRHRGRHGGRLQRDRLRHVHARAGPRPQPADRRSAAEAGARRQRAAADRRPLVRRAARGAHRGRAAARVGTGARLPRAARQGLLSGFRQACSGPD